MTVFRAFLLLSGAAGLAACGNNIGGSAGPCDGLDPDPSCGVVCEVDTECDEGFYCEASLCTADCTPGGSECGEGSECTTAGRCEDDGSGGGTGSGGSGSGSNGDGDGDGDGDGEDCPDIAVNLSAVVPTVQLVIDQSGSMREDFGNDLTRWEAVGAALFNGFQGATPIVEELQDEVIFGASLYTSNGGFGPDGDRTCPVLREKDPALGNHAALKALYDANGPAGDTPTAEAINAVVTGFPAQDPDSPAPRIIVLATDGEPDTCERPNPNDGQANPGSEQAVVAAFDAGIRTFVLSVGNDIGEEHLGRLANAGAGLDLATGDAEAFVANNPSELVDKFSEIIGRVRSCTFNLDGEVELARACEGTVVLNGTELSCDVDWRLNDSVTLELLGDACDTLLDSDGVALSADFPCGSVYIPE